MYSEDRSIASKMSGDRKNITKQVMQSPPREPRNFSDSYFSLASSPFNWLASPTQPFDQVLSPSMNFSLSSPFQFVGSGNPISTPLLDEAFRGDLMGSMLSPSLLSPPQLQREMGVSKRLDDSIFHCFVDDCKDVFHEGNSEVRKISQEDRSKCDGRDEPISLFAKVKKLTKANNKGVHASVIESSSKVANIYSSSRLTHPGNPYEGIAITASTRIPESYKEQPATPTKVKVEVSLKTKTQGSSSSSQSVDSVKQNVSTERAADEPESVRKNVKVSNRKRSDSEVQELVVKSKTFSNSSLQAAIQPSSSTKSIVQTSEPKKAVSSTPVEPIKVSSYSSPEAKIKCNCVKSRCLKLYCDCFAILKFCDATLCNCKDCYNCEDRAEIRNEAVKATKERNALAFQNKISDKAGHATGCRCKQSQCLKKYCECYNGGAYCGASCRCLSCQNFSGSNELERVKFETQYDSKPPIVDSRNSFYCKSSVMKNSLVGKKRKESPTSVSEAIKSPNPHLSSKGSSTIDHGKYKKVASSSEGQGGSNANHDTNMEISKVESDLEDKHKTKDSRIVIKYPFFGPNLPEFTKLGMLRCFEYLEGKDIYSASIVNSLWCKAAMDEALWEPCE